MAEKKNMDPIMMDLETLGTSPNSIILSIGAVKFDPDERKITDEFYMVVNTKSCEAVGMTVLEDTVKWWDQQSEEAQKVRKLAADFETSHMIQDVLTKFATFAHWNSCVWGNGSDFDNAMLQEAYKKCGMKQPWAFWNNRCYRTMKNMIKVPLERQGTYHNALDNSRTQAFHLMDILEMLRRGQKS